MRFERNYTPKNTTDPDAISANNLLSDTHRALITGAWLLRLYKDRFESDSAEFRSWITANLNRDHQTCARYMHMSQHADLIKDANVCRLSDAYALLGLSGAVTLACLEEPLP